MTEAVVCAPSPLQAMGGATSNAVNMQLSARTLALRAAQVRRRGGGEARWAWRKALGCAALKGCLLHAVEDADCLMPPVSHGRPFLASWSHLLRRTSWP